MPAGTPVGDAVGATRPGFSSIDSLGAYLTFRPHPDRTDADRNCISNIRPEGLAAGRGGGPAAALLIESARRGVSGVALKDVEATAIKEIATELPAP